jgi:hypothetical protein
LSGTVDGDIGIVLRVEVEMVVVRFRLDWREVAFCVVLFNRGLIILVFEFK